MRARCEIDWSRALRDGSGEGIRVGLLDTGVSGGHPDIVGKVEAHYEIVGEGAVERVAAGWDGNDHGTACAGILRGLAPDAEIHSVQVVRSVSGGKPGDLIAGFRYAIESGWEVINISAGSGFAHGALRALAEEALEAGVIVVAAKDNRPGKVGYPAAFPTVLAVDMEYFPEPFGFRYHGELAVEVEANGIYIDAPSAAGGRRFFTGSSFAAPQISAMAARIKSVVPTLDARLFREALASLSSSAGAGGAC